MLSTHFAESNASHLLIREKIPVSRFPSLLVTVIRSVLQLLHQRSVHVQPTMIAPQSVLALQLVASPLPWSQCHRQPAFGEHIIVSSCIRGTQLHGWGRGSVGPDGCRPAAVRDCALEARRWASGPLTLDEAPDCLVVCAAARLMPLQMVVLDFRVIDRPWRVDT